MSNSLSPIPQVLMYDTRYDKAFWVPPARSWMLLNIFPYLERIDPNDANYCAVLQIAPPKPVVYAKEISH